MADRRPRRPFRPRLDGIKRLTPHEIEVRDKRTRDWMNQRKIERVHEAAVRAAASG